MITYEEALEKARECWDEVNFCMDQTDAFVFSKKGDMSFGGNGPVAVLKESGDCINYVAFLDGDYDSTIISEKYI
jgi:hypothetical protein